MNSLPEYGAFGFGLVLGWFLYMVNRYRTGDMALGDLTTVLGAVGGAAVTTLFGGASGDLFGAYGIGLAAGFFGYFLVLVVLVAASDNFNADFFLDGRRRRVAPEDYIPEGVRVTRQGLDRPAAPKPE